MEISTEKKTEIPEERTWKTLKGKKWKFPLRSES